jgi:hypothetical protein
MIPARMCLESLDRRPGIRGQPGSKAIMAIPKRDFRSTPTSVHWSSAKVVRLVPILLRKSFWGGERKFLEPLMRFMRGNVRDHIVSSKIDHEPPQWR